MKISFVNELAGIVIILSDTQRICLSGGEAIFNLVENKKGCVEPGMPDGLLIEVLLGASCTKRFIEDSSFDPSSPKRGYELG